MKMRVLIAGLLAGASLLMIAEVAVAWLSAVVVVKTATACHKPISRSMVHL
jgi:hypothetical protein